MNLSAIKHTLKFIPKVDFENKKCRQLWNKNAFFFDPEKAANFIKFKLFPNFKLEIKASLVWIVFNWSLQSIEKDVFQSDRKRFLKKPKKKTLIYYTYKFDNTDSSTLTIINSSFSFFFFIFQNYFLILLISF